MRDPDKIDEGGFATFGDFIISNGYVLLSFAVPRIMRIDKARKLHADLGAALERADALAKEGKE
jgi:hypothetical protein